MQSNDGQLSLSGVWIANDFRSNLIIDRYDPVFADMRASKLNHLKSVNSEDVITWNMFRSLRQIAPEIWLSFLWQRAFQNIECPRGQRSTVRLWESVSPPLGLLSDGAEGPSEIDVIIETASWVWFIEAKYRSDISKRTTTRPDRDQVLRNIDIGTNYAGVRDFFFSLLIANEYRSRIGVQRVQKSSDFKVVREKLPHRTDGLTNLRAIGQLTWQDLANTLTHTTEAAGCEDERDYAARALRWLRERGLAIVRG
jgi:hypothetical protein